MGGTEGIVLSLTPLYEDNHLLVVVKPAGMPVQADRSGDPDLLDVLKRDLKARWEKPGNVFLGLVHRLDRPVRGVMVFAKTSKAAARLSAQVRARTFRKEYLAVVHGMPDPAEGRLVHWLSKDRRRRTGKTVAPDCPGARRAALAYRVLDSRAELGLVFIILETGRFHQIRAQFAAAGTPVWGDRRYGPPGRDPGDAMALLAFRLTFEHPTRGEPLTFRAEPETRFPWTLFPAAFAEIPSTG